MKVIIKICVIVLWGLVAFPQEKKITLAVLDFENNSIADKEKLEPLSKGISSLLVSKMSKVESITFVERERLNEILKELKLQQSSEIDPSTAQQIGKLLGAQTLIVGSFVNFPGDIMRVDLRIIETETGLTLKAEEATGDSEELFDIIDDLAAKVTDQLGFDLTKDSGIELSTEK